MSEQSSASLSIRWSVHALMAIGVMLSFQGVAELLMPGLGLANYVVVLAELAVAVLVIGGAALNIQRPMSLSIWFGIAALGIMLLLAILSIVLNRGDYLVELRELNALFRFTPLLFLPLFLRLNAREARYLAGGLVFVLAVHVVFSLLQAASPVVRNLTQVQRHVYDASAGGFVAAASGAKAGAVFGLFDTAPGYALLLGLGLVVVLPQVFFQHDSRVRRSLFVILGAVALFLSYKRGVILATVAACAWMLLRDAAPKYKVLGVCLVLPALAAMGIALSGINAEFVSGYQARENDVGLEKNFETLLSDEFWERNLQGSRGWAITQAWPRIAVHSGLVGLGADRKAATDALVRRSDELGRLERYQAFEDVYWVALTLYFGPLFVLAAFLLLYTIHRRLGARCRVQDPRALAINVAASGAVVYLFMANFLYQALDFDVFTFWLWLILGIGILETHGKAEVENAAYR